MTPPASAPFVTYTDLLADFRQLGLQAGDGVNVHSSLNSFGYVEGGALTVIQALMDTLTPSGTLVMPSFNHGEVFEKGNPGVYDPQQTPTINGAIPDTFWRMEGVSRSLDPTVLHVALGGLDQLGQLVVALHEQHVDVRSGLLDALAQLDEAVVDADRVEREDGQDGQKEHETYARPPGRCWNLCREYIIAAGTHWLDGVHMPAHHDLIVIGGGSGGLACAQRAADYGASVALVEPEPLGGTCVNAGCVPKKVMFYAASLAEGLRDAAGYGFDVTAGSHDWHALKQARDAYVRRLNGIYAANLERRRIVRVEATARFDAAHTVVAGGEVLTAPPWSSPPAGGLSCRRCRAPNSASPPTASSRSSAGPSLAVDGWWLVVGG